MPLGLGQGGQQKADEGQCKGDGLYLRELFAKAKNADGGSG